MSLINDMLQDLEARRAGELGRTGMQREVRPLPQKARPFVWKGVAVAILLATGTAALFWTQPWLGNLQLPLLGERAPTVSVPAEPKIPAPVSPLAAPLPDPSEAAPVLVQAPLPVAVPAAAASRPEAPRPAAQPRPSQAPAAPTPVVTAEKPGARPDPAPVPGNIEKTAVLGTPRERSDVEYRRAQALAGGGGAPATVADLLRGALRQDPAYAPPRQMLVKVLLESRRLDEAAAVLQEGLEQQPGHAGWAVSLARLQVERGDVAAAERTLDQHAPAGAGSAEYLGFHGHLLNRLGKFRDGAEKYMAATRLAPADGRWWFGLGQALEGGGRSEEARTAYRRAIEAGNLNADLAALAEQKLR